MLLNSFSYLVSNIPAKTPVPFSAFDTALEPSLPMARNEEEHPQKKKKKKVNKIILKTNKQTNQKKTYL